MSEQMQQNNGQVSAEKELNEVLKIRREKLANLQAEGENPFDVTKFDQQHHTADVVENYADFEGKTVVVAGRLMSKRVMGKMSFADLQDGKGKNSALRKKG